MATAALVSGIVGIVTCIAVVPSVLATVFGLVGAHQVKRSAGALTGIGLARAGWITGLVGVAAGAALWVGMAIDGAFEELPGRGMQVGTCVDLDDDLNGYGGVAPTVSCDEPHDAEVFEIGWSNPARDRPYPGDDAVRAQADSACESGPFEVYAGASSESLHVSLEELVSPPEEWQDWRGEYVCLAVGRTRVLTESLHDADG
jgi:hypothetical protein